MSESSAPATSSVEREALQSRVNAYLREFDATRDPRSVLAAWCELRRFGLNPSKTMLSYLDLALADAALPELLRPRRRRPAVAQDPWFAQVARWLCDHGAQREPVTMALLLRSAVGLKDTLDRNRKSDCTRVGHILAELDYQRKEKRDLPGRFYYVKRHTHKGDA
jgi:hypothetical protein